jgi:hypothetical protein
MSEHVDSSTVGENGSSNEWWGNAARWATDLALREIMIENAQRQDEHRRCGTFLTLALRDGPRSFADLAPAAEIIGVDLAYWYGYAERLTRENGETVFALDVDGMARLRRHDARPWVG